MCEQRFGTEGNLKKDLYTLCSQEEKAVRIWAANTGEKFVDCAKCGKETFKKRLNGS